MTAPMSAQRLFARLLADPALLPELWADPAGLAGRLGADPADAVRLSTVDPAGLRITAATARRKRMRRWSGAFPASLLLLAAFESDPRVATAAEAVRLPASRDLAECARRLATLADLLATDQAAPVLPDVIRFEVLWYRLRSGGWPDRRPRTGCPALGPTVAVASFGCQVGAVCTRIVTGRPFADLAGRATHYVMYMAGGHQMRTLPVGRQVARLLGRCDGRTSLPELAEAGGHHPAEVRRLLAAASARGFVHCAPSR